MARTGARLKTSIWTDGDFRALPSAGQRLYMVLLSQPTVSFCGVLPHTPRRWAALAPDTTVAQIGRSLAALSNRHFVMVDESAEECWIRSFIRHDGVLSSPNLIVALTRDFEAVQSGPIREAILDTLGKDFAEGLAEPFRGRIPQSFLEPFRERFGEPRYACASGAHSACASGAHSAEPPPPSSTSSSVLPAPPDPDPEPRPPSVSPDDDDEGLRKTQAACQVLALRDLARRVADRGPVGNPDAWMTRAVNRRHERHGTAIAELLADQPGLEPAALAELVEPSQQPRNGNRPIDATEATAVAARRMYDEQTARRDNPCPTCQADRFVTVADDQGVKREHPCPTCQATGIAPQEAAR